MYDVIYDQMVEAGVAEYREKPVYCDKEGNVVSDNSNKKYGRPCTMKLTKTANILFGDETGCNTNQTGDGNYHGKKFLCGIHQIPRKSVNAKDSRFTLLPITAANGNAVIYVVIFKSKEKVVPEA